MSDGGSTPQQTSAASGAEGGAHHRIRLARVEALQHRAARESGPLRQLLEMRVAELRAALADSAPQVDKSTPAKGPARNPSALTELLQQFADVRAQPDGGVDVPHVRTHLAGSVPGDSSTDLRLEHPVLADIRKTYTEVRARDQLRQALASAPADAGPLNSASLVHRALSRMHVLSPQYLGLFLAYVDALSALQSLSAPAVKPPDAAPRNLGTSRRPRAKPRASRT